MLPGWGLMWLHLQPQIMWFSTHLNILDQIRLHWPPTNLFLLLSSCAESRGHQSNSPIVVCTSSIQDSLAGINWPKKYPKEMSLYIPRRFPLQPMIQWVDSYFYHSLWSPRAWGGSEFGWNRRTAFWSNKNFKTQFIRQNSSYSMLDVNSSRFDISVWCLLMTRDDDQIILDRSSYSKNKNNQVGWLNCQ